VKRQKMHIRENIQQDATAAAEYYHNHFLHNNIVTHVHLCKIISLASEYYKIKGTAIIKI